MMFIRPTILRSQGDARSVTKGRFDHLITRDLGGDNPGYLAPKLKSFEPIAKELDADKLATAPEASSEDAADGDLDDQTTDYNQ